MNDLRDFMFKNVYLRQETMEQRSDAKKLLKSLFFTLKNNPNELPKAYMQNQSELENSVDYVAGMTDRFAISTYESIR